MSQELIILCGLPGSGKTTYACRQINADPNLVRVNRDELRRMLYNGRPWSESQESLVVKLRNVSIIHALDFGYSVIVDDTNIEPHTREQLKALAAAAGAFCSLMYIDTPVEECIRRDALRENPVGEQRIRAMWEKLKAEIAVGAL